MSKTERWRTVLLRIRRAKLMREARGLELQEVASETGIEASHLSRYERMERPLSYEKLKALAAYFGCEIDALHETVLIGADGKLIEEPVAQS